ncbi:Major Facilitator Superfamily protein [Austwickia chelonae]|uniref:Putative major facilitator superfamily transporter n=1 Tax=Austwickia chelonae NBRC 105200 TaxID=1184607 RepID=K6VPU6_9MICO|nr:MFS transporter [Austwickia chelonae]GAB77395.1 putative major facilitator superfamily transporter [Austwickia chelonae NBRC 105200]SEW09499.1 Major Facilitator Superfamily protein [Austwickia chelonae]
MPVLGEGYRAVTLSVLGLTTVIAFETMAIATAMPKVTEDLAAGSAYGLAFSLMFTGQLLGNVVAGVSTRRSSPMLTLWTGISLFALGSVLAGSAPAFSFLLAGRLLAGLGAGLTIVANYVVIGAIYPVSTRPVIFGWLSASWVVPSVVSPLLAALLTESWGWRSVFLLVAPLTAVGSVGIRHAHRLLDSAPEPEYLDGIPPPHPARQLSTFRTMFFGLTMTLGAGLFQAGTSLPHLPRTIAVVSAVIGLLLLGLAVPPLLPAGTLRSRPGQPSVILARFLFMASFDGTIAFIPLMFVTCRDVELAAAGALLALASLGWAAGSFLQSRPRMSNQGKILIATGAALLSGATFGILALDLTDGPIWAFAVSIATVGLAMGIGVTATSVLALELAPRGGHSAASSSLQIADVLGSVLGIAASSGVYAVTTSAGMAVADVFPLVWVVNAVIALPALICAQRLAPRGLSETVRISRC